MAVLRKDLFELGRPHTHTKIQFGDRGYWMELGTDYLPYGTIFTGILNFQMEDYCAFPSAERTDGSLHRTTSLPPVYL